MANKYLNEDNIPQLKAKVDAKVSQTEFDDAVDTLTEAIDVINGEYKAIETILEILDTGAGV